MVRSNGGIKALAELKAELREFVLIRFWDELAAAATAATAASCDELATAICLSKPTFKLAELTGLLLLLLLLLDELVAAAPATATATAAALLLLLFMLLVLLVVVVPTLLAAAAAAAAAAARNGLRPIMFG